MTVPTTYMTTSLPPPRGRPLGEIKLTFTSNDDNLQIGDFIPRQYARWAQQAPTSAGRIVSVRCRRTMKPSSVTISDGWNGTQPDERCRREPSL